MFKLQRHQFAFLAALMLVAANLRPSLTGLWYRPALRARTVKRARFVMRAGVVYRDDG